MTRLKLLVKSHTATTHIDMLAVMAGSCLIVAYLVTAWFAETPAHGSDAAAMTQTHAPRNADMRKEPAASADWVRKRKPVPDRVLYPYSTDPAKTAPVPAHEAKPRSWHNRILFPTVRCPYCGRRVPTRKGSYFWLIIGFIGQIGFTARFLVQWLATEKARASVVPTSFWYLSIFGSILLLAYAVSIVAWPIILGQLPNVFIYGRNLYFIRRRSDSTDNLT